VDNSHNILQFTYEGLTWLLHEHYGKGGFHAAGIFREVFKNGNINFTEAKEFKNSPVLARSLSESLNLKLSPVIAEKKQANMTKFVTRLYDGFNIESVIVPMKNHTTICISSQAGCKMGCAFCETAQRGLNRNLSVQEIVEQVYRVKVLQRIDIRNVVFMGMGEPFDNFDNVVNAIQVMNQDRGMAIAHRNITVSTAGHVKGIQKLAKLNCPNIRLAVSLNAPNDNVRSMLMPINKKYPMKVLRDALAGYPIKKNGIIFIEYVLIKNINDRKEHAFELADYLKPLKVRLNLIPYNPGSNANFVSPSVNDVESFRDWLVHEKVFVRVRSKKGQEIMAGCGQLGAASGK